MLKTQPRMLSYTLAALMTAVTLSACATSQPAAQAEAKPATAPAPVAQKTDYYFVVHHENGRIYPIADKANYLEFLGTNELIYTRTRVGEGPDGATLVFGIQKKEADDLTKLSMAEQIYEGKYEPTGPFYGEVFKDGRFYVFGEWKDFKDYKEHGEMIYTFTEVGSGPNGETVIYGLNKESVKAGRPVALVEKFNTLRQSK